MLRYFSIIVFLLLSLPSSSFAQEVQGYVLTHEHPTQGMAFGGNYGFAGAGDNYRNGIMVDGYTAQCGGCKIAGLCDHGEVKGSLGGHTLGKDMGVHSSFDGPLKNSFSHLRYSTEWIKEAFDPSEEEYQDARARILVAYAVESEAMCEQLYYVNKNQGGAGEQGYPCSKGDSYDSMVRQLDALTAWVEENNEWMEIAYNAADARRIVNEDKLAVILGVEAEYAFGSEASTFDPVDRLNDYYNRGVRTFYLAHKINSRLSGADIFLKRTNLGGRAIRVNQAISGCFYYDDNVGEFPLQGILGEKLCKNERRCGINAFKGPWPNSQCSYKLSDISEFNMARYLVTLGGKQYNGFRHYPLPPGFTTTAVSFDDVNAAGSTFNGNTNIERNNLGLSHDGERVVREAMLKGMIITIDHVSSKSRRHIKELSEEFNNYPLNALHNKPNERLTDKKGFRRHEYDFDGLELDYVKDTGGFFGYRIGPTDAIEDGFDSGIVDDCPKTSTEAGKHLAWLLERGLSVGYSLDYSTITEGIYSRTETGCDLTTPAVDNFHSYDGHVTEGLSHIGMMKKLHGELEAVGLKDEYLNQLKNDGVEQFLVMWENSEARSDAGQQIDRVVFASAQAALGASCENNTDCLSRKCQGSGNNRQCVCNVDAHCPNGQFCNNRLGQNRCLADRTLAVGASCDKNKECVSGKCQGTGDDRQCVCNVDSDCSSGQFCNNRIGQNRCLDRGSLNLGDACSNNTDCRSLKCQGTGNNRQCVCDIDSDCDDGEFCNRRIGRNMCEAEGTLLLGALCDNNSQCQSAKCQGSGDNRRCVCDVDSDCASGEFCNNRLGQNRCLANRSLDVGESCDKNQECSSGKCQGTGNDRECVCNVDTDCGPAEYCNNRASKNRCLAERTLNVGEACDKNKECRSNKCQGSGDDRECVCSQDTDCPDGQQCRRRVGKNECR